MVGGGGGDAVFEEVAGLQAEDADGFDADVVVGGEVDYGGIGIVGDGAGKNVRNAAAGVSDADERDFDGLEGAVEIEIEAGELADAQFIVDFDAGVDLFAGVAVDFEAIFRFEQLNLCRICFRGSWFGWRRWLGFLRVSGNCWQQDEEGHSEQTRESSQTIG